MHPHEFWQEIHPPGSFGAPVEKDQFYPATLDDGRQLLLPIRPLSDGRHALASLIVNQASFEVLSVLAEELATKMRPFVPEVIVGLPTLGLTLASEVARQLVHSRYVPLGTSRKFWYVDELSVPMSSVTTQQEKRLYIDPRMLPLLKNKRVVLIDDVISSGASITAGLSLLEACGVEPVAIGAAMLQSERWRETLEKLDPTWPPRVRAAFSTPLLTKNGEGWM